MPTSSEFVSLCQSQVALLSQGLGAALSIVYLTEELTTNPDTTDTHLIPIVSHPEAALDWGEDQIAAFLTQIGGHSRKKLLSSPNPVEPNPIADRTISSLPGMTDSQIPGSRTPNSQTSAVQPTNKLLPQQQIILPLIYQGRVMGLLVTARADRAWTETEQAQIEHVAQTLTAACVLDRRAQWLAQDLQRQQLLEERKNDLFDDLLHQFRNPLTALRTFGKLMVKRLRPGESNYSTAQSIVRESDRLQDLLKQLDAAIDLEAEDLVPLLPGQTAQSTVAVEPLLLGSAIDLVAQPITAILQPLLDSAAAIAQERQLILQTAIPTNLPPVLLDQRALREVLSNLIDNALKYTPAGGKVYVAIQRPIRSATPSSSNRSTANVVNQVIVVADTGPGIPPEDVQHLFERHYRGVQAASTIPGTGLGLAIAKELIQQMQGEIQLFSPAATSGLLPAVWGSQTSPGTAAVVWLNEAIETELTE